MIQPSINRLQFLCDTIPPLLSQIEEQEFSFKSAAGKWNKKEIIGHLIDSATNNHHRFVRGQFEKAPKITYNQNRWNEYSFYQKVDGKKVISFWTAYNRHLLELIQHIPQDKLHNEVNSGDETKRTLEFLINDYVTHLEHHLRQIVNY